MDYNCSNLAYGSTDQFSRSSDIQVHCILLLITYTCGYIWESILFSLILFLCWLNIFINVSWSMWKNRRIYQLLYHIFFKNWITNGKFLYWYVCYRMDLVSLPSLPPSPLWEAHPLSLHLVQLVDDRPIEFEPHCLRYLEGSRTKHGKNKVSQACFFSLFWSYKIGIVYHS